MNNHKINLIALALGFVVSAGALAQGISEVDYQSGKDRIAANYKSDMAGCSGLSGNTNDICVASAKGKEKVAIAELEASYKPTIETRYQARVARAEADFALSKERCDEMSGNAKDVCVKEAEAAETTAKADAELKMKTTDANATANEKSDEARSDANAETSDARKDAAADKLGAEYKVAKEKCDIFSGDAKDGCLNEAKASFGM